MKAHQIVFATGKTPFLQAGAPFPPGFRKIPAIHNAVARMRLTPRALSITANRLAFIPRTRRCFTSVGRSKADIVDSTPDLCRYRSLNTAVFWRRAAWPAAGPAPYSGTRTRLSPV